MTAHLELDLDLNQDPDLDLDLDLNQDRPRHRLLCLPSPLAANGCASSSPGTDPGSTYRRC